MKGLEWRKTYLHSDNEARNCTVDQCISDQPNDSENYTLVGSFAICIREKHFSQYEMNLGNACLNSFKMLLC